MSDERDTPTDEEGRIGDDDDLGDDADTSDDENLGDDEAFDDLGADPVTDGDAERFDPDPERVELLRGIAEEVRDESAESEQLANVLYRTSDIYDPDEDATPEDVVQNMKFILEVKERGGLDR